MIYILAMDIESMHGAVYCSSSELGKTENEALNPPHITIERDSQSITKDWSICGERVPKNQVTFLAQIIVVYGIIIVSVVHISLQSANQELWLVLLSSAFGYILPNPGLKYSKTKSTFDVADLPGDESRK